METLALDRNFQFMLLFKVSLERHKGRATYYETERRLSRSKTDAHGIQKGKPKRRKIMK